MWILKGLEVGMCGMCDMYVWYDLVFVSGAMLESCTLFFWLSS